MANKEGGKNLFWVQLKTLIWKNLTLRRRNWVFFLLELIFPLVLFFIIVIVRLKRPPNDQPPCHLRPKALPSAGFFPFLQTFVCTVGNECTNYPPEADPDNSLFGDLVVAYTQLLADNDFTDTIEWVLDSGALQLLEPGGLFNLNDSSIMLSDDTLDALANSRLNVSHFFFNGLEDSGGSEQGEMVMTLVSAALAPLQDFELCTDEGRLTYNVILTREEDNRTEVAQEVCALTNKEQRTLIEPVTDVQDYFNIFTTFTKFYRLSEAINRYDVVPLTTNAFETLQTTTSSFQAVNTTTEDVMQSSGLASLLAFTCGPNSALTGLVSLGAVEEIADGLGVNFRANSYKNDPDFSDTCNSIFEVMESNVVLRTLWRYVKPVILGKIFYSPNTPATEKVMSAFNETFEDIGQLFEIIALVEASRDLIFAQLYDYFNDSSIGNNIPFLDTIVDFAPVFLDFSNFNTTARLFFSNQQSEDENSTLYTWQNLFNSTFDVLAMSTDYLQCIPTDRLEGFNSEDEMIDAGTELLKKGKIWAGIVFTNIEPNSTEDRVPPHLKYKIRMNTDRVDSTNKFIDRVWFPDPRTSYITDMKPYTSGQVFIMDLLEKAVIKVQSEGSKYFKDTGTWLKQFPSPCYKQDEFLYAISRTIPLFMTLAWLFSVGMIVKGIVYEKETRLKEVMKIMGLGNSILWLSWFITTFILLFSAAVLLSTILKLGTVLSNSNFLLTCFMFVSFTFPTITFCFLVSTFFSKANLASACAGIAFFCMYLPYTLYLTWEQYITSNTIKYSLCLSSNVAFGFACSYFAYFEQQGTGVQWDNINTSPNYKDNFSLLEVIFMMYFDAIIYLLLALYIEQVFPGAYGVPKKWYFIFEKKFWVGDSDTKTLVDPNINFDPLFAVAGQSFETEPKDEKIGVQIRNMTKIYPTGNKLAVDQLSINFYENQITSFLGHNGAGKTTTLSIITGLFSPSFGTAFVNGLDIRNHMDEIRRSVGMCPQYNVLFDYLTVAEHLLFYGKLRGRTNDEIKRDTIKLLQDLNLPHKSDEYSKNLSGGMKRKLSVAVSFVGGNKTVILDEPTAGVDPFSRRGIWELLSKYKEGRTIILSTHHMDEADVLGDRIAIIANGKLQCSGSSLFLRRHFGDGYLLTVAKKQTDPALAENTTEHVSTPNSERSVDKAIEDFVTGNFEGAWLLKSIGQEMTFVLPYVGLEKGSFNDLFEKLEKEAMDLSISDYGLSDTSLEEIFIKVADQAPEHAENGGEVPTSRLSFKRKKCSDPALEKEAVYVTNGDGDGTDNETDNEFDNGVHPSDVKFSQPGNIENGVVNGTSGDAVVKLKQASRVEAKTFAQVNVPKVRGPRLLWLQFCALYIKRFHHLRKDKKAFFTQIILPACFVFLAMFSSMVLPDAVAMPNLELQPWIYGDNLWMFFSDSSRNDELAKRAINDFLVEQPHHSTRCVADYTIKGHACKPDVEDLMFSPEQSSSVLNAFNPKSQNPSPKCSCETGHSVCDAFAGGPHPAEKHLASTDKMQDLTDRNLSDYLVKTRLDYRLQRFYGFEFEGQYSDFNLSQAQLIETVDAIYKLIDQEGFLSDDSYSNGLSWKTVINNLRDLLNVSVAPNNVKVWWNNKAHHGMLSSVNAMHNVLLRSSLPDSIGMKDKAKYGITAYSHPWDLNQDQLEEAVLKRSGRDLVVGICVIFAMSFVPASFILYLIDERVTKSKHLQYVSGVNPAIFWISTAAWDFTNYLFPATLCLLIFLVFQAESYVSSNNLPCLILLLLLYGISVTPLMYPACYVFNIPSTAYVLLTGINAFIGINATTATYILDFFPNDETLYAWNRVLKVVFMILFPQYCLGRGLFEMALNQLFADQLGQFGEYELRSPLEFDIAGKHLLALAIQSVVFFTIVLCIEHVYVFRRLIVNQLYGDKMKANVTSLEQNPSEMAGFNLEEDVYNETCKILSGGGDDDPVVVKRLRKVYGGGVEAVKDLSFSVPQGQCFGLLGVNGAGKTTTFNILTGDDVASSGQALIGGHDILTDLNNARKKVGFCPQFDALDPLLTVKEHVALYARLRGIQNSDVDKVTEGCIFKMGLSRYRNKQSGTLSGGNKRKLSTAIALVGDPQIIFLDEPTSGMDPKARRYLWQCIHDAVSEGRSVVLTSHSMEECEALCTRLAIMVNGQFKCLGTSQHIKTKYGDGYIIQIKMPSGSCDKVEEFFISHFPTAKIMEKLPTLIVFQLGQKDAKLGDMFLVIEKGKKAKVQLPVYTGKGELEHVSFDLIEDYSVSQTTLDQVFINFAKNQSDIIPFKSEIKAPNQSLLEIAQSMPRFAAATSMISLNTDLDATNYNSKQQSPDNKRYLVDTSVVVSVNDLQAESPKNSLLESQNLLQDNEAPVNDRSESEEPTVTRADNLVSMDAELDTSNDDVTGNETLESGDLKIEMEAKESKAIVEEQENSAKINEEPSDANSQNKKSEESSPPVSERGSMETSNSAEDEHPANNN